MGKNTKGQPKYKENLNLNQQSPLRTANMHVHSIVYNCAIQHRTVAIIFLISSRQLSLLKRCGLLRAGSFTSSTSSSTTNQNQLVHDSGQLNTLPDIQSMQNFTETDQCYRNKDNFWCLTKLIPALCLKTALFHPSTLPLFSSFSTSCLELSP